MDQPRKGRTPKVGRIHSKDESKMDLGLFGNVEEMGPISGIDSDPAF